MAFTLPALSYDLAALEPHIDARTMEIHHGKHHAAYVNNLNAATKDTPLENMTVEEIMASISKYSMAVRNNGGGHYNHSLFWELMAPGGSDVPEGKLAAAIDDAFGSFDGFKSAFTNAATTRFGSGWAWLVKKADGSLVISSTPNQDNPLMDNVEVQGTPILGLDVWEHAYYLNYQNRRLDYISAFFNVINWTKVAELYGA